jgi:16S rRNA C967 or C1407 C5-methylase (RsmB/RsmF family)
MKDNLKSHHVKCVRLKCNDFLSVNPEEYEKVEYILLDPSCSGKVTVKHAAKTHGLYHCLLA